MAQACQLLETLRVDPQLLPLPSSPLSTHPCHGDFLCPAQGLFLLMKYPPTSAWLTPKILELMGLFQEAFSDSFQSRLGPDSQTCLPESEGVEWGEK